MSADNGVTATDKRLLSVDNGVMSTDNGVMATDNGLMATDKRLMSMDKWQMSMDKWLMSTDKWLMSTDKCDPAAVAELVDAPALGAGKKDHPTLRKPRHASHLRIGQYSVGLSLGPLPPRQVTLTDGSQLVLEEPSVSGDTLSGLDFRGGGAGASAGGERGEDDDRERIG